MWNLLKAFWEDEDGAHIIEYITWVVVVGLGAVGVLYGVAGAQRGLAGKTIEQIEDMN